MAVPLGIGRIGGKGSGRLVRFGEVDMINQPPVVRQLLLMLGALIGDGFLPQQQGGQQIVQS